MNKHPVKHWILKTAGSAACMLALLATLGGHWAALQSVAWASMISQYVQQGSLTSALCKTFDGRHPCALCHAIQEGRQQERSDDRKLPEVAPDPFPELWCEVRRVAVPLPPSAATRAVPFVPVCHSDFRDSPPVPPPRPEPGITDSSPTPVGARLVGQLAFHPEAVQPGAPHVGRHSFQPGPAESGSLREFRGELTFGKLGLRVRALRRYAT